MFNWFNLNIVYYPVSAIMWIWYKLFVFFLGSENFFSWALSVAFLVFTLRAILYRPFVKQIRTTKQIQELQPQIKEIQKKYNKDKHRMALEIQKLQHENGFNPILGCLPMMVQVPVFLGLYHVLMSFNRNQNVIVHPGLLAEDSRSLSNYVFSATDVGYFLDANLFGAPLGATMLQQHSLDSFASFNRTSIVLVSMPIMILAGIATHFNSRASIARQNTEAASNPQTILMNKIALYIFPLGVIIGGPFLPIAVTIYWLSNNIWTYSQQSLVFKMIEKEEKITKLSALSKRLTNAPLPGIKPNFTIKHKHENTKSNHSTFSSKLKSKSHVECSTLTNNTQESYINHRKLKPRTQSKKHKK